MHIFPSPALLMDIVQLTQSSAEACFSYIGSGDCNGSDQAAVNAMRTAFQNLPIKGTVVIGEGERDQAPMLYIGEKVGQWGDHHPEWDIAVDPLEGTNLCAKAQEGALSVVALAPKGGLFKAPDIYMEKIAGGSAVKGHISLNKSVEENIQSVTQALGKNVSDITVAVLNRSRHQKLIQSIKTLGARVHLIDDGDIAAAIQTCLPNSDVDLLMGSGGSPEGVLAAAALQCLGGDLQARLIFDNVKQKNRAVQMGIHDENKIYSLQDLVRSPLVFCATGVTNGPLLQGIQKEQQQITAESLYMDSHTKTHLTIRSHVNENGGEKSQ